VILAVPYHSRPLYRKHRTKRGQARSNIVRLADTLSLSRWRPVDDCFWRYEPRCGKLKRTGEDRSGQIPATNAQRSARQRTAFRPNLSDPLPIALPEALVILSFTPEHS
jgi:hypothetical protein